MRDIQHRFFLDGTPINKRQLGPPFTLFSFMLHVNPTENSCSIDLAATNAAAALSTQQAILLAKDEETLPLPTEGPALPLEQKRDRNEAEAYAQHHQWVAAEQVLHAEEEV
jgi:hypothetical protein